MIAGFLILANGKFAIITIGKIAIADRKYVCQNRKIGLRPCNTNSAEHTVWISVPLWQVEVRVGVMSTLGN